MSGMGNTILGFDTNLTIPTLPANPTPQQILQFEQQMMLFSMRFKAVETGISTVGEAGTSASGKTAQAL